MTHRPCLADARLPAAELFTALLEPSYAAGNSECAQPSLGKPTQALFVLILKDLS